MGNTSTLRAVILIVVLAASAAGAGLGAGQEEVSWRITGRRWLDADTFAPATWYAHEGAWTRTRPAGSVEELDLGDAWLIPPLADAHQHTLGDPSAFDEQSSRFLEQGVFYVLVQDPILRADASLLARAEASGSVEVRYAIGPVIPGRHGLADYYASLAQRGLFGDGAGLADIDGGVVLLVDDAADLERSLRGLPRGSGAEVLKIILAFSEEADERRRRSELYGEGISRARPGLDPALVPDLVAGARERGYRVSAHVETVVDFRVAVAAGVDMIAHLPGWHVGPTAAFDDDDTAHWELEPEDARTAAAAGVAVITTALPKDFLSATDREAAARVKAHNVGLLVAAGARVAIGSDAGERTAPAEIAYLAEITGLDAAELLRMAVVDTPRLVFPDRRLGAFEEGNEASFLALREDPTKDLGALRSIEVRFKEGRLLEEPE